jgi:hypothetical protein
MTILTRIAALAATLIAAASHSVEAQPSSIRLTITGGAHAGTYELKRGQCDGLRGQIISMFQPEARPAPGSSTPESIELYTEPGDGKRTGFSVIADFRDKSGRRIQYEIYAIPPELQGPGPTKPPKGSGSVTIREEATGTFATFRGETADGVRMEGSVDCRKK